MKQHIKIFGIVILIGLLASCTNRRYSHLTGFRNVGKEKVTKVEQKDEKVEPIAWSIDKPLTEDVLVIKRNDIVETKAKPSPQITENEVAPTEKKSLLKDQLVHAKLKFNPKEKVQKMAINKVLKKTTLSHAMNPVKTAKGDSVQMPKDDAGTLIYWILVVVLVILILSLLNDVLGPLYFPLITIVLIILIGHLLGLW